MTQEFDPITLEIYSNRLVSVADEAAAGLVRTAFSTIVRESNDYATVLMDRNGDSIAENTGGIASFSCILPLTTKKFLELFPADAWKPGDVVITNDPWLATGHLPDFTVVTGVFHRNALVGFMGCIAHSPDVGGALWSADCRELFEEGIRIRPSHLMRAGEWNEELLGLLLANVRVPEQVRGDLEAQVVANELGSRRLQEFLDDTGLAHLQDLSTILHTLTDKAMRNAIRALPDGVYRSRIAADGFDEQETVIECAVTIKGDSMHIDYAGTSPQIGRGINCVWNYTYAYSVYPVKCSLDPFTLRNEGSYRAITVAAPERSILNPAYPAPVSARQLTGHLLAGAVYKALSEILPDRIIAECGGAPTMRALFSGYRENGDRFSQVIFASGGMGAAAHRDGMSTTAFPTNVGAGSIEALESCSPLVIWSKELLADSGGPGRFRGGLGQKIEVEIRSSLPVHLSLLADRHKHPASGFDGGHPGAAARIALADGTSLHPKSKTILPPGSRMTLEYAGGGGYGPPGERSQESIGKDLQDGYITGRAARDVYGYGAKK
jgi:N-methylhydantoinase B